MKKISKILVFALLATVIMGFTACGEPQTLEEYAEGTDIVTKLESGIEGMSVSVKDNDVYYTYDLSTLDIGTLDEEAQKELSSSLDSTLEQYSSMFESLLDQIEKESEIKGIKFIVRYTLGDDVIAEKTFTSTAE